MWPQMFARVQPSGLHGALSFGSQVFCSRMQWLTSVQSCLWQSHITISAVFCCQMSLSPSGSTVVELNIRVPGWLSPLQRWLLDRASWFLSAWLGTLCCCCWKVSPGLRYCDTWLEWLLAVFSRTESWCCFRAFISYTNFLMKYRKYFSQCDFLLQSLVSVFVSWVNCPFIRFLNKGKKITLQILKGYCMECLCWFWSQNDYQKHFQIPDFNIVAKSQISLKLVFFPYS